MEKTPATLRDEMSEQEQKLAKLLRRSGEFIAYFELADAKMIEWQQIMEERMHAHQRQIDSELKELKALSDSMKELMTEAGVARWRIAAQDALTQGKAHLHNLDEHAGQHLQQAREQHNQMLALSKSHLLALEKSLQSSSTNIAQVAKALDGEEFKQHCDQFIHSVTHVANGAIVRCQGMIKRLNLKVAVLALVITMISTLATGFYLSDEMPWETHKAVMAERHAGKTLLSAWSGLSSDERQKILVLGSQANTQ